MTNTRTFYLEVDESLIPLTKSKRKGFNSIQMSNGMFFNTKARLSGSQTIQFSYAVEAQKFIMEAIKAEIRSLQRFWYTMSPRYFNRRTHGMYYYGTTQTARPHGFLRSTASFRKEFTHRKPQFKGRQRTGQLRRALIPKEVNINGAILYVRPCYASTGHSIDYVNILITGASAKWGTPYNPLLDRRVKSPHGIWRGISPRYWAMWQAVFQKRVRESNARLNVKIEKYLIANKIMEKRDIKRVSAASSKQKDIKRIQEEGITRKTKTTTFKPGYNKSRNYDYDLKGPYKGANAIYRNFIQ